MTWITINRQMIVNMDHIADIYITGNTMRATMSNDPTESVCLVKYTDEEMAENPGCLQYAFDNLKLKLNAKDVREI
jgi:hypothetical protein